MQEINVNRGKFLQIIWLSEDRSQSAFDRHLKTLNPSWLHLPFDPEKDSDFFKRREDIKRKIGVCNVPNLVVFSHPDCMILSNEAREDMF